MVNWSQLEGIVDLVLIKLLGSTVTDGRAHIVFAQMTFQAKLDSLKAIAELLATNPNNTSPHAKFTREIYPKLRNFQIQRNSIAHCRWVVVDDSVSKTRLQARGKLKISNGSIALEDMNKLADDIQQLSNEVWVMVQFDEFNNPSYK